MASSSGAPAPAWVEGNFIGTDASGTTDPSEPGTTLRGVYVVEGGTKKTIGGTSPAARNVISGAAFGVFLDGSGNTVVGNYIGTTKDGTGALGNDAVGVVIYGGNNVVGGAAPGAAPGTANVIAFNKSSGVVVQRSSSSTGNRIRNNSIHSNGRLGIDLSGDGVTLNDPKDPDTGSNNLQNYPQLSSAVGSNANGTVTIRGELDSTPGRTFLIEIFSSPEADPSGFGEGKTLIDSFRLTIPNDSGGAIPFTRTDQPEQAVSPGDSITATATDE
jgi:parallel beta-helix repeat protein